MSIIQMPASDLEVSAPQSSAEEVGFGSTVSFTDQRAGRDQTFRIVASYDAKPQEGTLSIASPVAARAPSPPGGRPGRGAHAVGEAPAPDHRGGLSAWKEEASGACTSSSRRSVPG